MVEHGPAGATASLEVRERRPGPSDHRRLVDGVSPGHRRRCVCRRDGRSPAGRPPGVHDRRGSRFPRTSSTPGPDRSTSTSSSPTCFARREPSLVRLVRLFVDDRNAAEDLVQEAFIRLARSAHRIKDQAKAPAYLRSIVLNLARDNNRRGLVSLRHHLPFDDDRGVDRGRDRAPRRPAAGHRRAPRAAAPSARLPRAALLRRARASTTSRRRWASRATRSRRT